MSRNQLTTIHPWSKFVKPRREIQKHALVARKSRKRTALENTVALRTDSTQPCEAKDINAQITNEPIKPRETETVTKTVDVVKQIVKELCLKVKQ